MRFAPLKNLLNALYPRRQHSDATHEISAVYVDVRNFTRFSENLDSSDVMLFLREYYAAVGKVAATYGGTIKDYAGDGILILVGAPQPLADHADRAVKMAIAIRAAGVSVTARWERYGVALGIGIGVASGVVTLGMVGGPARREYAAVGPAVNLAARLCSKAGKSEILLDEHTQVQALAQRCTVPLRRAAELSLKGISAPVMSFAA
ncbi:MAG: adenylate/guanylate cyclase domain-containing protein [Gammaproteobacteria bacterium]